MPTDLTAAEAYFDAAQGVLGRVRAQGDALAAAADLCAEAIAGDGVVHAFGTGHSRIPVEELFPRHGSYPGFHSLVELSLTFHNQVVGANGQRQAMFIEKVEGLGRAILRNFVLEAPDCFLIFSNSGVNEVVVEVALGAKEAGLPVIAAVSVDHCQRASVRHSCGQKLIDLADVVLDNGVPAGDAMVEVEGVEDPVGPGSTIGFAAIANALKCLTAQRLAERGAPPLVLTSSHFLGSEKAAERFDACYDEYRRRMVRLYGGTA